MLVYWITLTWFDLAHVVGMKVINHAYIDG